MADRLRFDIEADSGRITQVFRVITVDRKEIFEEIPPGKFDIDPESKTEPVLKSARAKRPKECKIYYQDGAMWMYCPQNVKPK